MTGIEGAALAGASKALGAVAGDMAESRRLEKEIRKAENLAIVEAARETEGFKRAAEIRGKKLAVKEQLGLALMRPLAGVMGIAREYFATDFGSEFAQAIQDVPEENLQTPKASIAGPVWEGLGYSLDEPDLKSLYLQLLATASDDRVDELAHPSFVEVIRQLTAVEARILGAFVKVNAPNVPVVQLQLTYEPEKGYTILIENLVDLHDETGPVVDPMISTYVANWVRLGLVDTNYSITLQNETAYEWVDVRPEVAAARANIAELVDETGTAEAIGVTGRHLTIERGTLSSTAYGRTFVRAVGLAAMQADKEFAAHIVGY